jgi:hypothetical protein
MNGHRWLNGYRGRARLTAGTAPGMPDRVVVVLAAAVDDPFELFVSGRPRGWVTEGSGRWQECS